MNKVFVYGTLKKGFNNHKLLKTSKYLGKATTTNNYTMVSLGYFPGVIQTGSNSIRGEMYEVKNEDMPALDRLEGHPSFYKRELKEVKCQDTSHMAWIYLLDESYLSNTIVTTNCWK